MSKEISASVALLALALSSILFSSCASVSPQDKKALEETERDFTVGNYVDALQGYRKLAPKFESAGYQEAGSTRLGEIKSLYRLRRYEEASEAFKDLNLEELPKPLLHQAYLYAGHTEVELGRRAEPSFVEETPLNAQLIKLGQQKATNHYQLARNRYNHILTELDAGDLQALQGKGECFLRLGMLSRSTQLINKGREFLKVCADKKPQDLQVLFLLGKTLQEDLGAGKLIPEAANNILAALKMDREGNYDFHVAYRDILVFVKKYKTPPVLIKALDDAQMRKSVEHVIEFLAGYLREGRRLEDPWGKELDEQTAAFLKEFQGWSMKKKGLRDNITLAQETIRKTDQQFYLDAYRDAMNLLQEVAPEFQSEKDYIETRKEIQEGYVEALLRSVQRLVNIGEWQLAKENNQKALDHAQREYVREVASVLLRGQENTKEIQAKEDWHGLSTRIREFLVTTEEFQKAKREYQLSLANFGAEELSFINKEERSAIEKELEKGQEIAELFRLANEGEKQADNPEKALDLFSKAHALAEEHGLPFWQEKLRREIASVYFRQSDFQRCLDQLSELRGLRHDDILLTAKCYYHQGMDVQAGRHFNRIEDPAVLSAEDQKMAGLTFMKIARELPGFERSRAFLERAPADDPEVKAILRDCYHKLFELMTEEDAADRRPRIDLLTRLTELDPDDFEARRAFGCLLCEIAQETKDIPTYQQAYWHLLAANRGGAGPRNDQEKEWFGRLVACFADYQPLAAGNTWTYTASDGSSRVVEVSGKLDESRYRVQITDATGAYDEVWFDAQRLIKRHNAAQRISEEFPIGLASPDHLASWGYTVRATDYQAKIVATGVECLAGGKLHTNCIQVQVTSGSGRSRDYFFAAGLGEIKMQSSGLSYELSDTNVKVKGLTGAASGTDYLAEMGL